MKKIIFLLLAPALLVGCTSQKTTEEVKVEPTVAVKTEEKPQVKSDSDELDPESVKRVQKIARDKYEAKKGTGLTIEQFKKRFDSNGARLEWTVSNPGTIAEIAFAKDKVANVDFNFYGPKNDLKRASMNSYYGDSAKMDMFSVYLYSFLKETLPNYSQQEIADLFNDSLIKLSEQKQESAPEVIHEIDGKRITITSINEYYMLGIDVESDKNELKKN